MNGIQQCIVSFSVFADFYDLLFPGSPEDEESGSLPGEPLRQSESEEQAPSIAEMTPYL